MEIKSFRVEPVIHIRSNSVTKPPGVFNKQLCTNVSLNELLEETSKKRLQNNNTISNFKQLKHNNQTFHKRH